MGHFLLHCEGSLVVEFLDLLGFHGFYQDQL